MSETFVRVRDARTGHEYTVTADALAIDPGHLTKIKGDATDGQGRPLPATYSQEEPVTVDIAEPKTPTKPKES